MQLQLEGKMNHYNALKAARFASFISKGSAEYEYPLLCLESCDTRAFIMLCKQSFRLDNHTLWSD